MSCNSASISFCSHPPSPSHRSRSLTFTCLSPSLPNFAQPTVHDLDQYKLSPEEIERRRLNHISQNVGQVRTLLQERKAGAFRGVLSGIGIVWSDSHRGPTPHIVEMLPLDADFNFSCSGPVG